MAFETGSSFDYHDLLDKLRIFLTATNVQASGTLTLTANFANNDTVTIGNVTYTLQTTLVDSANNVLIGASASASIDNIVLAVTAGSGAGTNYGSGTVANPLATAAAGAGDTMTVTAVLSGTQGNSVATTETSANASFGGATLSGGVNGAGWTQLEFTPATARDAGIPDPINDTVRLASVQTLSLQAPGTGSTRRVFVSFQSIGDVAQGRYSWNLYGHTAFAASTPANGQPNVGPSPFLNLTGGTSQYWFWANDRRVIAVVRIGTTYVSMYMGFLRAFGLPSEYPFPLYIAGNYISNRLPTIANARNRFIADPGFGSAYIRYRDGNWEAVHNHAVDTTADTGYDVRSGDFVWPFRSGASLVDAGTDNEDWTNRGLFLLRANVNNEIPIFQCNILETTPAQQQLVAIMDGVFAIPGFNRTTEETLTVNSRTLRVFSNVFRSSARDFMAIEETI